MSYLDMNDEQMGIYPEPEIKALPKEIPWGLANTPTTLTVLGLSLAKSMGFSPMLGGIAGAVIGGVIIVLVDKASSTPNTIAKFFN